MFEMSIEMLDMIEQDRPEDEADDRRILEWVELPTPESWIVAMTERVWPTYTQDQKAVKGRVSRKGVKAGPHVPIVIDQVFGSLKVTGRAPNDRKHRRVFIECSLCGGKGTCRFSELCGGVVRSCGCLERQMDAEYQQRIDDWVFHLGTRERKSIFRDMTLLGTATTMKLRPLSKRHLDTLWRIERNRPRQDPPETLEGIHRMAQSNSAADVAVEFKRTEAEVLHITRAIERTRKATMKAVQATWDSLDECSRMKAEHDVREAGRQIDDALELAATGEWTAGRYAGELTHAEFSSSKKYSYFAWVHKAAILIPEDVAMMMFGDRIGRFIRLVQYTKRCRVDRRRSHLESLASGGRERKRPAVEYARRGHYYCGGDDAAANAKWMTLAGLNNHTSRTNKVTRFKPAS
jgi:hypothetical protein